MIGNAIKVARIATGKEEETLTEDGKDKAAEEEAEKRGVTISEVYRDWMDRGRKRK